MLGGGGLPRTHSYTSIATRAHTAHSHEIPTECLTPPGTWYLRIQAALAVNFLGPCAAARTRSNSFLNARCTTYTTTPHFLSLKAQKCDLTCPSPATAPPGSSSEPGYTTRQICTIRTVSHIPNITLVHTLSISMLKHGTDALRCPPMRLCCCDVDCRRRVDVLALVGRRDELP